MSLGGRIAEALVFKKITSGTYYAAYIHVPSNVMCYAQGHKMTCRK